MRSSLQKFALFVLCLSLASADPLIAKKKPSAAESSAAEQRRAVHALNRLTFGPRPGDLQQVMAMGIDRWIDLQLHPEKIQDAALEARLAPFRTLRMNTREIVEEFPDQRLIREVMNGKRSMPSDPAKLAVFQVQIARMQEKKERKEEKKSPAPAPSSVAENAKTAEGLAANDATDASSTAKTAEELAAAAAASPDANANSMNAANRSGNDMSSNVSPARDAFPTPADTKPVDGPESRQREQRLYADLKVQSLLDQPPQQRYKTILAMSTDEQLAFADALRGNKGHEFFAGLDPKQKETLLALNNPQAVVTDELIQAKLLRAIYSERQLEEVMTDFWFNHFNVFLNKGADRVLVTEYEQNFIRPHALGKFEDLLVATAKSPAMLFYLDNWMSVGPNSMQAMGISERSARYGPYRHPPRYPGKNPNANEKKRRSGLNENYGRELLELHTLSVNGGYSQRDVTEVAKVLTGWTIDKPYDGATFRFDLRMHEPGPKFVLGHRIRPKGEDEGREVLHMLATSKQTAHFISWKLAQRFVSDDPPPALVDRMARTFEKKKGDIREVLATLFHSPEFWADTTYRAKVKTPLEFVVSAMRATGAEVEDAMPLARQLNNMGMPLYQAQPPTGYSMKAETWVSSSSLLNRMNFALALTAGKVRGVNVNAVQLAGDASQAPDMVLSTMETKLLGADVSKQTHDSIIAQLEPPKSDTPLQDRRKPQEPDAQHPPDTSTISGLLLGSPEFQKR